MLTPDERAFFRDVDPWGFILFGRNIQNPAQVSALTRDLRESIGRGDAPILVDQEGGRVQRLGPPHWPAYPRGRVYGGLSGDAEARRRLCRMAARLIARDLADVGINVNCIPVLDVPVPGAHDVIGERAYGTDPEIVADLGRAAATGLMDEGVLPVMKHVPGHGRAGCDSHFGLPVVTASRAELESADFRPFRALRDLPLAMTAHVVYTAIDPDLPATLSSRVIADVIRGHIGFDGLLMSDDLSMKALSGTFMEKGAALFRAGCDVGLHCNGERSEMEALASVAPVLAGEALRRAEAALARIAVPEEAFDPVEARAEIDAALAIAS